MAFAKVELNFKKLGSRSLSSTPLWTRQERRITVQRKNATRANLIAAKLRGTYLIAMTFAFIIPYSILPYYAAYKALAKPSIDVQTDYMTRSLSAGLRYSNRTINFIIYVVQVKDFRAFLKKLFCGSCNTMNPNPSGNGVHLPNNRWIRWPWRSSVTVFWIILATYKITLKLKETLKIIVF